MPSYGHASRVRGLDGLRAIAVIGVLIYHMEPHVLPGGFLGVNLFFVLSGYLIARKSPVSKPYTLRDAGSFYLKRIRRIYPALVLTVLLSCFAARFIAPHALYGVRSEVLSIIGGYNNWWQIAKNESYFAKIGTASLFTHMWSLAIELQFYLIWPVLLLIIRALERKRHAAIPVLLILAALSAVEAAVMYTPHQDPTRVYYGTDTRISAMLAGCALGLFSQRYRIKASRRGRVINSFAFCGLLALVVWMYFMADGMHGTTYCAYMPLFTAVSVLLIALCADGDEPFGRILDFKPLALIGRYSYEIYLIQFPAILLVRRLRLSRSMVVCDIIILAVVAVVAAWMKPAAEMIAGSRGSKSSDKAIFGVRE